jgi:hypothetical protein
VAVFWNHHVPAIQKMAKWPSCRASQLRQFDRIPTGIFFLIDMNVVSDDARSHCSLGKSAQQQTFQPEPDEGGPHAGLSALVAKGIRNLSCDFRRTDHRLHDRDAALRTITL